MPAVKASQSGGMLTNTSAASASHTLLCRTHKCHGRVHGSMETLAGTTAVSTPIIIYEQGYPVTALTLRAGSWLLSPLIQRHSDNPHI